MVEINDKISCLDAKSVHVRFSGPSLGRDLGSMGSRV